MKVKVMVGYGNYIGDMEIKGSQVNTEVLEQIRKKLLSIFYEISGAITWDEIKEEKSGGE